MIFQNTSETLKISRAGTTFCGKKNGGVKHPSGVTQLVVTLRTSRWIRVAKITTSSHPTNGWEVVGSEASVLGPGGGFRGSRIWVFWVGGRSKGCLVTKSLPQICKIVSVLWLDSLVNLKKVLYWSVLYIYCFDATRTLPECWFLSAMKRPILALLLVTDLMNSRHGFVRNRLLSIKIILYLTLWLCQNSYWKWPFVVDLPIKNGGFPSFFVNIYQRATVFKKKYGLPSWLVVLSPSQKAHQHQVCGLLRPGRPWCLRQNVGAWSVLELSDTKNEQWPRGILMNLVNRHRRSSYSKYIKPYTGWWFGTV